MTDAFREYQLQDLRGRVEQLFCGIEFDSIPTNEWSGESEEDRDVDGKKPLLAWERVLLGRDILSGLEVTASDRLALLEQVSGELIMERYVCLETEDDDEETVDFFSMNMYTGDIYYEDQDNYDKALQKFTKRFSIVEDI